MKTVLRRGRTALAVTIVLACTAWAVVRGPHAVAAASFPDHAVSILVTFPPGGGTDLLARKLGERLTQRLGQPVVVQNRPGASGNIGARAVAESPADGYTLLMVNSSFAINPGVYRDLPFSPRDDFDPVINVAFVPSVIVVGAQSPWQFLSDLLSHARTGESVPYASCGNGTPQHLAGEMLRLASDSALQHVPYRGCGPALMDAVAGQVPAAIVTASSASPFLKAGKLRALAITAAERSVLLPDVPTVAEQGYEGYALNQWHGLLAPAGTPPAIVQHLNQALAAIVAEPAMQADLQQLGFDTTASSPAEFRALIDADIERFGALTAQLGLRAD